MTEVRTKMAGDDAVSRAAYQVVRAVVRLWVLVWNRVRVEGRHSIPATGPYVLAPVHRSGMDTPSASRAAGRRMR
jgi:1-acyl-sn-glycerol-3-phosphate acyltransferase